MNKRYFMIIAITIVISSVIAYYYLFHTDSIREKEMDETDFLKDKVAVVYYSTTIDTRPGKGFAVFIDQKGEAYPFETKGLELGSSAFNGKTVFIEEIEDFVLCKTPFLSTHFKRQILSPMEKSGTITVVDSNRKKTGSFPERTKIRFN